MGILAIAGKFERQVGSGGYVGVLPVCAFQAVARDINGNVAGIGGGRQLEGVAGAGAGEVGNRAAGYVQVGCGEAGNRSCRSFHLEAYGDGLYALAGVVSRNDGI